MRTLFRMAALTVFALAFGLTVHAQTGANAAEQQLFSSVNRLRADRGLPALQWNEALATAARHHAGLMAQHGAAEHVFAGEPALAARVSQAGVRFTWLAENVVQGGSSQAIHAEFAQSPNHRANLLDSDMNSIGIGVVERGGRLFAVEDFCKVR